MSGCFRNLAASGRTAPRRRALVRPPHLCRGRGGRSCRCHQRGRRQNTRPLAQFLPLPYRMPPPLIIQAADYPPLRPQAPPVSLAR